MYNIDKKDRRVLSVRYLDNFYYMEPEIEGRLVSDHRLLSHRLYTRIGMTFLGLCFLVGAVYTGYVYYAAPMIVEQQQTQFFAALVDDMEANPGEVTFTIVPDAQTRILVPEPVALPAEALALEFAAARAALTDDANDDAPTAFDVPVGEVTYLEYLSTLPAELQTPLFQMHQELRTLTKHFNQQYPQETLATRAGKPNDVRHAELANDVNGNLSVYPSLNVVEAYFIEAVLAREFPSTIVQTQEYVDQFVSQGIAYGHYTAAEAAIARMLATDYITEAEKSEAAKIVFQSLEN